MNSLQKKAKAFLKDLIRTPSLSREEGASASVIESYLSLEGIAFVRQGNNVWARNKQFDPRLPSVLLNSHHDTVKPNSSYTIDPFVPLEKEGKLFGLGSNDAGASLVGLWAAFVHYYAHPLNYNLIYAASAEEEISGENGIASILSALGPIDFAIVGEPTEMNLAVAEKGLLVLDCRAHGTASHAAHPNDNNSIYKALDDIQKVRNFIFDKKSEWLGSVKSSVTIVSGGSAHNVVPDYTDFTIDVRTNECYSNEEIVKTFESLLDSEVKPRSLRLNSSKIDLTHPIVKAAQREGALLYGSPTVSDQALMPFDSVKLGIGKSTRSHTADEFIYESELSDGIENYIKLLSHIL